MKFQLAQIFVSLFVVGLFTVSCGNDEKFTQQGATESFVVDYNPEFIDVLWMIDDRSPMNRASVSLVEQAKQFFIRLDGSANQYRMGIVTADMQFSKGSLQPRSAPVILQKGVGTAEQRAENFGVLLSQFINLNTSAFNRGLESVLVALKSNFVPQPNVPLVLVFISYTDDASEGVPANQDAVDYFADQYLALKDGNKDLLRVFSVNYRKLESGEAPSATNRCASLTNNEIDDSPGTYGDHFNRLAQRFNGDVADLCGANGFAADISLSGLAQKELPNRFRLAAVPQEGSVKVTVLRDGQEVPAPPWIFEPATNEVVFSSTPPQGTTVVVNYFAVGSSQ